MEEIARKEAKAKMKDETRWEIKARVAEGKLKKLLGKMGDWGNTEDRLAEADRKETEAKTEASRWEIRARAAEDKLEVASRQRKEAAGGALRIQLTAGRLLGKVGAGGNTGKILGIHKFHAQAGQLLEATEKGRQAAGGGQQEASGDGGDRPRSVIKEESPGTRLGGGAGSDSREGRMEARKALFCGISGGEEQNEGGAEDGAAAEITTEGIQEEAQGEIAQGHMTGDKKTRGSDRAGHGGERDDAGCGGGCRIS